MSEALPGQPAAPPPSTPRDAAAVVLCRRIAGALEVYWVRREAQLRFAAGFYAFPGGRVDASDSEVVVDGASGEAATLRVTAARELFEEAGVLIAEGDSVLSQETLRGARKALLDGTLRFPDFLARHHLGLRATRLLEAGRYVTPPSMPHRFDCRFFLVEANALSQAEHWPGELAEGAWVSPAVALERWNEGTALLHPPSLHALQTLAHWTTLESALAALQNPPNVPNFVPTRVEFQRGIRTFPLETETLLPATHTNCYLLGNGELLIVDPGSKDTRQNARLFALVAGLKAEGKRPLAVVLTHHHRDHVDGALAVSQRLGIPIWAHRMTAERVTFPVQRMLEEDEILVLQGAPTMSWRVLHTPGHARGHICLVDLSTQAAIVGDMVAGFGTILIDPPEGDMTEYLRQLERLQRLPVRAIYPAHGPPLPDGPGKLGEYLWHREARERKVLEALRDAGGTLPEIAARAYADTVTAFPPLAQRSTQAILIKLVREGRVTRREDRYFPTASD